MFSKLLGNLLQKCDIYPLNPALIEVPGNRLMGDFAYPCFSLAKEYKKAAPVIAQEIVDALSSSGISGISEVKATGPYVNIFLDHKLVATTVLGEINKQGSNYGYSEKSGKTWLLEGWQPNTHKSFHVGHLRNALVSEGIAKVAEAAGYDVVRTSYMGDIGAHVAKRIWYYTHFLNTPLPQSGISEWAGEVYAAATAKVDENPEAYKKEIHEIQRKLEAGDEELVALWQMTRDGCLKDMKAIFEELGCTIQRDYYESEVEQPGIALVKEYVENGTAGIEYSEGAVILRLEDYNLGVFVLLKSNGTSLYSTKDIALAYLKSQEYKFDKSIYVVATEQIHHFNQLFKTLELIGYPDYQKLVHIPYEVVELTTGKMSSRSGNMVTYGRFRDQMIEKAKEMINTRDLPEEQKKHIAESVAFGAMKFGVLLTDSFKKIIFDPQRMLSFEGETGPYLQYTHARAASLLRKVNVVSPEDISRIIQQGLTHAVRMDAPEEKVLLLHLSEFKEVIVKSANQYQPYLVARYLLDLCHLFNGYYHKFPVLGEDAALQTVRMALIAGIKETLKNGFSLLGIDALDQM